MTVQTQAWPDYGVETVGLFDHIDLATTKTWRLLHGLAFFIGGSTFIVGTIWYFFPTVPNALLYSGIFYVVGSLGFLFVDVLEFFTYTDNSQRLRTNISLSATGSTLYVIGSIGFLPSVYAAAPALGPWGFILGSAFIFGSQSWKVLRIVREDYADRQAMAGSDQRTWRGLRNCSKTSIGVEADAGLGALMFLIGTVMYVVRVPEGAYLTTILWLWIAGSVFFTIGALFLNYRHFVMKLCR